MGCYAYLKIGDLTLLDSKGQCDPAVLMLFTENDKHIIRIDEDEADESSYATLQMGENSEDRIYVEVCYLISLSVAKDRLEFMGFTLSKTQALFYEGLKDRISELNDNKNTVTSHPELVELYDAEIKLFRTLTFDKWLESFNFIIKNDLSRTADHHWFHSNGETSHLPHLVRYMLDYSSDFGFPHPDFRAALRAMVEITGTDIDLVYDITELVAEEYIFIEDDLCTNARWQMTEDFVVNHKIVVLTEGYSDRWAIQGAFQLLYPHLADYYSFMDFDQAKAPGGAGHLASTVKSFYGAGIVNKIIAIFDNDTAAKVAVRSLQHISSNNIKIIHYPTLELAQNYPTLGPQGTVNMDVNGLACSLELYFGLDVLKEEDGSLCPVQWRGYDDAVKQYQGEVMKKDMLKARFAEKLKRCQADPDLIDKYDWSGMKAIIECLLTAFHED
jgi:HEPN superfamily Toprim-like protein